jgi:hypothetical protein
MDSSNMSVSDNSTIAPSSDVDFQSLDGNVEGQQPGQEIGGVAKKFRRARRVLRPMAYAPATEDGAELLKHRDELSTLSVRS